MRYIESKTWVAVVPTRYEFSTAPDDDKPRSRFYYLSEATFLEGLLRPETASLLRGVQEYDSMYQAVAAGPAGMGLEVTANGEVMFDGRHPERDELFTRLDI